MAEPSVIPEVVIPNVKRRFSGITSTILQVLPGQLSRMAMAVYGHPLPGMEELGAMGFWRLFKLSGRLHPNGYPIIFHARRNDDMIVGLFLKAVLRRKLHLVFTSVAQREHSWLTRFLYRRMDTLLSTSERSASFLKRAPLKLIPHGTDTERYRPSDDRAREWREGGLPGERGIGIFGRVRASKGIDVFVEALCEVLPRHPGWTAVIVGETLPAFRSYEDKLKTLIKERGLEERFVWLGKRPFGEIPAWFRRMSLVAAVSRSEGFGLTCLEAMASGAPVVGSRAGAFEMIIRPGIDGEIVETGDASALASAFEALLGYPARLEAMGAAARERVLEGFTVEREVEELLGVYRDIQDRSLASRRS